MPVTGQFYNPIATSSIDVSADGRSLSLAAAYKDPIDNAGLANGFVKSNGSNEIPGNFIPTRDTWANLDTANYVPAAGQLLSVGEQLLMGNGAVEYGNDFAFSSECCVTVGPRRTAIQSAQAVLDAYTRAKALTPFGSALSATNRARVRILPGFYDFHGLAAGLTLDTAYVDLVGCDPLDTCLQFSPTYQLIHSADNVRLANLTFYAQAAGTILTWGTITTDPGIHHRNLRYLNSASVPTGSLTTMAGRYEQIYAENGTVFYGGLASGGACSAIFQDFEVLNAVSGSFLGGCASSINFSTWTGRAQRVRATHSTGSSVNAYVSGEMVDCHIQGIASTRDVVRAAANGKFFHCRFRPGGTGYSIGDSGSATNVMANFCTLAANGLDTNITNLISGASVISDGNWSF